ncbi:beta-N-acetylhexosaminidase [Peribacillus simplex]|uniref:beta-N-acetylhexosaminidase n=1 Tax=Peribacillus simplex TaxID=1478 RepID=UPI0024C11854|nr:beta-N-acetylhexosaminidase [Peribacillus simplex]WHY56313.1 beta-N-acetylhexosaminidase [Peribacillus simplex]
MKNKKIYMGLLLIAILAFSILFIQLNTDGNFRAEKGKDADADSHEKIEKLLKKMTLEEKIGQLMMVGFKGTEKGKEITELIEQKHIGGVIYFDRNMKSPKQVARLSNSLQQTADQSTHSLPLMVAIDQEGGDIIRMKERVSPIPSQQDLGKNASIEDVYKVAKLNGTELGSMGININFAPVLDLSKTDKRSFGQDPEKVHQYGKKAIQGLSDVSITGALKHFPGNGRSEIDPHVETSSVEANQLDLENSDIYPFKQIIREMDNQKFFVMVTHIKYPAYDTEKPASLSKIIIEDLLRGKLKYEGLVVTDDLEMGAVNKYYSYEEMGKQAILAGADLLLVCHEYSHELEVYNGLLQAVKAGEVPMDRINESVKRVLTYKLYNMKQTKADPDQAEKVVKNPESIKYIESLGEDE